jgi:hypothetical integral membrane protein (TIGR02206 family)
VRQFSIAHDAALAVLLAGALVVVWGPRHHPGRWIRWAAWSLAAAIFAGWAGEYVTDVVQGIWTVRFSLPLQLTDAVSLAAIVALLTRRALPIELLYFWGFSASLQAVLTPDLGVSFPNVLYFTYFLYHDGSILAALLLVFGCRRYPRPRAMWWVFAATLGWAAVAGTADVITGGNYMYLAWKPTHNSLLNVMGPWPAYIAAAAAIGLAMFAVLAGVASAASRHDQPRRLRLFGDEDRG